MTAPQTPGGGWARSATDEAPRTPEPPIVATEGEQDLPATPGAHDEPPAAPPTDEPPPTDAPPTDATGGAPTTDGDRAGLPPAAEQPEAPVEPPPAPPAGPPPDPQPGSADRDRGAAAPDVPRVPRNRAPVPSAQPASSVDRHRVITPPAPRNRSPIPPAASLERDKDPTATVLPGAGVRRPPPRPVPARTVDRASTSRAAGRPRTTRLALKRIDPWSVFLFSLLASVFAGVVLVVAVAALFAALTALGVVGSVNELVAEVTGGGAPLFTSTRFVGGALVLAAANVVLLTLLATLSALLYNLCASFSGGIEVTFGERDS